MQRHTSKRKKEDGRNPGGDSYRKVGHCINSQLSVSSASWTIRFLWLAASTSLNLPQHVGFFLNPYISRSMA
jgi:hypothetical protein